MMLLLAQAAPAVTWIKVEKPTFDLVGLILGSIALSGLLALVALTLGGLMGYFLIHRTRQHAGEPWGSGTLQIDLTSRPT